MNNSGPIFYGGELAFEFGLSKRFAYFRRIGYNEYILMIAKKLHSGQEEEFRKLEDAVDDPELAYTFVMLFARSDLKKLKKVISRSPEWLYKLSMYQHNPGPEIKAKVEDFSEKKTFDGWRFVPM